MRSIYADKMFGFFRFLFIYLYSDFFIYCRHDVPYNYVANSVIAEITELNIIGKQKYAKL